ncbi:MAG TPA: hypothetical protein VNN80_16645, partial [Polyangiaceae bacterium]|nr:hypothetical protein [Polyangiaceae bacterium]
LGWPTVPELVLKLHRGQPYSLFFRASAVGPFEVRLQVKVAHRDPPWAPLAVAETELGKEPTLYRIDFVAAQTDDNAAIGLVLSTANQPGESTFCFDDVVLVPRALHQSGVTEPSN